MLAKDFLITSSRLTEYLKCCEQAVPHKELYFHFRLSTGKASPQLNCNGSLAFKQNTSFAFSDVKEVSYPIKL